MNLQFNQQLVPAMARYSLGKKPLPESISKSFIWHHVLLSGPQCSKQAQSELTHLGREKVAAISQTIFSSAFF